jgi:hypothetical protein
LSYADFLRGFGGPHPLSDLAQSVKQFFDNGGTDCYVVRLAPGAAKARLDLQNLAHENVLAVAAKAEGLWGQDIKLEIDYNTGNPDDTFNLRVIYESNGVVISREDHSNLSMNPKSPRFAPPFVTQSSALVDVELHPSMKLPNAPSSDPTTPTSHINLIATTPAGFSQSRRPFNGATDKDIADAFITAVTGKIATGNSHFILSLNGSPPVPIDLNGIVFTATVAGLDLGAVNSLSTDIEGFLNAYAPLQTLVPGAKVTVTWDSVGANARLMRIASASGDETNVRIGRAPAGDLAGFLMMGLDQGGIEVARYSNMRPVFTGSVFVGGTTGAFIVGIDAFAGLAQTAITDITISRAGQVTPPPLPHVALNLSTAGTLMYDQSGPGLDGVREKLRLIVQAINADLNMPCKADLWGYHIALTKKSGSNTEALAVQTTANVAFGNGFVHNARQYNLGPAGTTAYSAGVAGNDGTSPFQGATAITAYLGDPIKHTGFSALDKADIFNLMVIPGDREVNDDTYAQVIGPASIYCQQRRAFLLIDAPDSWTTGDRTVATAIEVNQLRALPIKNQSAVFYPKIQYSDAGLKKWIGPAGIIAGLMARIDSTRGVWKAPAGIEADLRSVLDVQVNLTDLENGVLNKLGINCIRKFPNGIINWGARTLDGSDDIGSEWKYIPIRRLALFLEESLFRGTKWVVFEPNDEPLWAQIRLNLNAFMMSLFRQGAFQGTTPDKAFFVKCDKETTTQNDRNLGIVNIEVGFAPLKPAEFVVIKIQQIAGDL